MSNGEQVQTVIPKKNILKCSNGKDQEMTFAILKELVENTTILQQEIGYNPVLFLSAPKEGFSFPIHDLAHVLLNNNVVNWDNN